VPPGDPLADLASLRIERKEPNTSGGRRLPWGTMFILGVLIAGGVYAYPRIAREAAQRMMAEPPTAMVVKTGGPQTVLVGSGYVNTESKSIVGVTTGGRLVRRLVKKGDRVRRGQLIASLDSSELDAQLTLARAQLAEADRNLKRAEMLKEMKAGTEQDFDRALSARDIARAQIGVLDARIKQMRISSPIDGMVIETLAEPGEILMPSPAGASAGPGSGIAKVADLSKTVVEVDVNEADLGRLVVGQGGDISLDAYPGKSFSGRVLELARQADKAKATVQVKVLFDKPDAGVLPGMSAKVQFRPQKKEAEQPIKLVMPRSALMVGSSVFVAKDGKAEKRTVEIKEIAGSGDTVEVVSGVSEGELVLTGELDKITHGMTLPKKK
jgi:RND family efflux transporter MFP subunit